MTLECAELQDLIRTAYGINANGTTQDPSAFLMQVEGGPGWINSERYSIDAKAEGDPPPGTMLYGPMMQGLLEERFKLKVHRVTKEATVYFLTVAKGGQKFPATKEGSCVVADINHALPATLPGQPQPRTCGSQTVTPNGVVDMYGGTMANLCLQLAIRLGSNVIDKTGISGRHDIHLELSRADMMPVMLAGGRPGGSELSTQASDPTGPSIFTAVQQQLGLKLESGKGPAEFLVIDHIERPSDN